MFIEPKNWTHHTTFVTSEVKIHHVDVQPTKPNGLSIVLIHGFPQTWYSWRHMMQPLTDLGYRVIAVDYRGAGDSNHPAGGYDKMTMAQDIHTLYHDKLHIEKPIVFGTDIGSMVAVSLAIQFEDDVLALVTGEAPIPGTDAFEEVCSSHETKWTTLFHFFFHNCPDLPEALTQGKERIYIEHFYDRLCYDPSFLSKEDVDVYESKFEKVGAMRAGFETYRAFRRDTADLQAALKKRGKLHIPVLLLAGEASTFVAFVEGMTKEFAENVTFEKVPVSCHWYAEENPQGVIDNIQDFVRGAGLS